jgi:hypothetical protein
MPVVSFEGGKRPTNIRQGQSAQDTRVCVDIGGIVKVDEVESAQEERKVGDKAKEEETERMTELPAHVSILC